MSELREHKLALIVAEWLRRQGYTVFAEVPFMYRYVDLVGLNDANEICAIELKTGWTKTLLYQAHKCCLTTNIVYAAAATKPRQTIIDTYAACGIGMLRVGDNVEVLLCPGPRNVKVLDSARQSALETLNKMIPNDNGGLPQLKGVGPAIHCAKAVIEYRKTHPKAGWKELYEKIPNHYCNHKSMACAFSSLKRWGRGPFER